MLQTINYSRTIICVCIFLVFCFNSVAQFTISGPTCVQTGIEYTYTQSGLSQTSNNWNWFITNGIIVSGSSYKASTIRVIWNDEEGPSGVVGVSSNVGTKTYAVTISSTLNPGIVSSTQGGSGKTQSIITGSIPGTIYCTAATGGGCSPSYSYNWQKSTNGVNWLSISGATGVNLTFTSGLSETTYFRRLVTVIPNNQQGYSDLFTVNVTSPLTGGILSPSNQEIVEGSTTEISIGGTLSTGGNCGTYNYQWQYSIGGSAYNDLPGYAGSNLTIGANSQTTKYRRKVTCGTELAYSTEATVTVIPKLVTGSITASKTITYNTDPGQLVASASTGGNCGTYSYQWQKIVTDPTFEDISGAISLTYSPGLLTSNQTYRLRTICGTQTVYSPEVKVTVTPVLQPGAIALAGTTITYNTSAGEISSTSSASGGNCSGVYTYTWQSSTDNVTFTDISGTNSLTYTPPAITSTTHYRRKVICGTETKFTNSITVTVMPHLLEGTISGPSTAITYNTSPGTINSTAPASAGNCAGSYNYTWQSSTDNVTFTDISGSNTLSYSPPALTLTTYYKRRVICGTETKFSNTVTVTVMPQLQGGSISGPVSPITYNTSPGTLSSTAGASGGNCSGTYNYQWQTSLDNITFTDISGANAPSYLVGAITATRYYKRKVICGSETKFSNTITITVMPELQPGAISLTGTTITYNTSPGVISSTSAATNGNCTGTYTYTWQSSTDNVTFTDISGTNSLTYTPPAITSTTHYRRKVICGTETKFTNSITVTVMQQLQGGSISGPSSAITYNTSPGALGNSVTATGGNCSGTYNYTWQSSTNNVTFTDITNSNSLTYTPPALTVTTYYKRRVVCGTETKFSNTVTVTVMPQLQGGSISGPASPITYNTSPGALSSAAGASGGNCASSYSYIWQSSTNNVTFNDISGANGVSYSPPNLTTTTYYRRKVTCNTEIKFTNVVTVTVTPQLQAGSISGPAAAITYNSSATINSSTAASGGNCSGNYGYLWQWSADNITFNDIPDAIGATYITPPLTLLRYYRRKVICGIETKYSGSILVSIMPQLEGGGISVNSSIINFNTSPGSLNNIAIGRGGNCSGSISYQWQSSTDNIVFNNIPGATGLDYTPPSLTQTTYFRRQATCGSERVTTNTIGIIVRAAGAPRCFLLPDINLFKPLQFKNS